MTSSDDKTNLFPQYSSQLVGTWKCISFHLYAVPSNPSPSNPHGDLLSKPQGDSPLGRLSISPTGWLAVHSSTPSSLGGLKSGKSWHAAPEEEVALVARGLTMYCGYLEVFEDEEEGQVWWRTRVEVAADPGMIGGKEERRVRFEREDGEGRDVMVLEPMKEYEVEDGTKARAVLKWVRMDPRE
ncbi:uncharacterized protein MYCGRDRAFT_97451 [Zymoseptoria tritici IPO323]|uniref:Lipocalin-like domain-containing protein n=1 Tax=Zymoseptoria tritici (strain CBS 115943 / IPO323) TaxID=336722 RepID=F9XQ90_ZYMTI|nr:uncharacterized protein MYCGRDRAFT_97451 [Zymoseptoria tritici IPO323]EGP82696.1 hypothetical protein MYCGRDRAFT_97451 [Zymoseptoria tritici IPO323]